MDDEKIVIKLAYKGSTISVWSKADYFIDVSSQLNDNNVYQKCNAAPSQQISIPA